MAGKFRLNQATTDIICRQEQATCTDFDTVLNANTGLIAKLAGSAGKNAKPAIYFPHPLPQQKHVADTTDSTSK